jgi:hypothetical protein
MVGNAAYGRRGNIHGWPRISKARGYISGATTPATALFF